MKKWFGLLLVLIWMLPGCAKEEQLENPVLFYYRTAQVSYFGDNGVIDCEKRESGTWPSGYMLEKWRYLLNQYMLGPESSELSRTFPDRVSVLDLQLKDNVLTLMLSADFAKLTGLDLSLACACLTLTACQMTGAKAVKIWAQNALLDGNEAVTMEFSRLVLEDLCRVPVDPN